MRTEVIALVVALCAIASAEDAPEVLFPCSFRLTMGIDVRTKDGEWLATSMNEMMRDNGEYWLWKSEFQGSEFISTIIPDHRWSLVWRPDTGLTYRFDLDAQKCYVMGFDKQPTPYNWIQSKTYGLMWFDEVIMYKETECTLFTAIGVGSYHNIDFESSANFYVNNSDGTLLHVNGTMTAAKRELDVVFEATSLYQEHNVEIEKKNFAVSSPCPVLGAPDASPDDFKQKCYNAASMLSMSWLALVAAILVALLSL